MICPDCGTGQVHRILQILQNTSRTFTCGPVAGEPGRWFARVDGMLTFRGATLVDALAQLATTLALDSET